MIEGIHFRTATGVDVPAMADCRLTDPTAGPADSRMAAYFEGRHHPQEALPPRTGFVALAEDAIVGYIAGHLTTRHGCAGEVQYLFVAPAYRRRGIATALLHHLAEWLQQHGARRVCVCVDGDSPAAEPFYDRVGAVPFRRYWRAWEDIAVALTAAKAETNVKQAVPLFWVHDIDASLRFYVEGLGFKVTTRWVDDGKLRWCWLELGEAAIMLQGFLKDGPHANLPDGKLGQGVTICFICKDAVSLWRELVARGVAAKRPFVGNGMWVAQVTDPDGYDLLFESPTDAPEESVLPDDQ